jgi:MFS transporter, PPP family, 3-phenylpropionic acid transporter
MLFQKVMSMARPAEQSQHGLQIMRLLYFLYYGAIGAYWTFLNVYYRNIGLSGTQIGLVNTLAPLVGIFSSTLWGLLNDRLGNPRRLLLIAAPGVIGAALLLSTAKTYGWIMLFAGLLALFTNAIPALMDNTTLRLLGERRGQYGQYRVAGSVGFIITSFVSGYVYVVTGLHWIFYAYAVIMGLYTLAAGWLPREPVRLSGSLLGGLNKMVRQPAWLLFAFSACLLWISNNGSMNFIGIVVQGMGGSDQLIGLAWMTSALAEIPIMLTGDQLLQRVGHTRLLIIAFTTFALRSALLAVMPRPEWAPIISLLGGISYALFWVSAVSYSHESAPEHLKSTAQGLLFSIMNVANMGGSLSSGWLYDHAGPRGMFWAMTAFAASGLVLFIVGRMRGTRARNGTRKIADQNE